MNYEFLIQYVENNQGFIEFLPIKITDIQLGKIRAILEPAGTNANPKGGVHGGCFYAVADTLAGTTAMTHGYYVTTVSGHIHYLKPGIATEPLYIETQEIHAGRQLMTYDVIFRNEKKECVCKATLDFYVLSEIEDWKKE